MRLSTNCVDRATSAQMTCCSIVPAGLVLFAMWLGTGGVLASVLYASGSPLIALGLVLLLPSLHRKGWMLRVWWQLHRDGPQVLSRKLLRQSKDKVVTQHTAHWGKITYIGRADVAKQVFQTSAFVNRLGSEYGLKLLGMHQQGIIWNNDTEGWELGRKLFSEGIQGIVRTHEQHVKQVCIAAFKLTFAEECHRATSRDHHPSTSPLRGLLPVKQLADMPLSQLASEVAGLDLDLLPDGRDFLRLITFRVTTALALGLPVDAFNGQEALQMVRKVAEYFRAWEYFFLRPAWLCHVTSWRDEHKHHLQAIQRLQSATQALIQQATTHSQQAASKTLGNDTCRKGVPFESTFLGKALAEEAKGRLNNSQVQQLVLEMLLAGTDTSSVSLYYLMVDLQGNRALENLLRDEVLAAAGNISNLNDAQLAQQLEVTAGYDPLLSKSQAALCEAMRYKPVGPVVIRQAVKPVTLTYTVAAAAGSAQQQQKQLCLDKGDTVIISLETMHRDPHVFAAPDRFCPFTNIKDPTGNSSGSTFTVSTETLPTATAAVTSGANTSFRPFGKGKKGCVGQELGWMEMKMILMCWQLTMRFRSPPEGSAAAAAAAAAAAVGTGSNSSNGPKEGSSSHTSLLDQMTTRWEVASQPTNPISLHLRCVHSVGSGPAGAVQRVYVVGAHGSGKTTLCQSLMSQLTGGYSLKAVNIGAPIHNSRGIEDGAAATVTEFAPAGEESDDQQQHLEKESSLTAAGSASAVSVISVTAEANTTVSPDVAFFLICETARGVMAAHGINRNMLADPKIFQRLQRLIIQRQLETENRLASGRFVSDRCVVDALAYTADRFGIESPEVADLLTLSATQELLQRCRAPGSLVLVLPPFHAGPPADDGVRLLTETAKLTAVFETIL